MVGDKAEGLRLRNVRSRVHTQLFSSASIAQFIHRAISSTAMRSRVFVKIGTYVTLFEASLDSSLRGHDFCEILVYRMNNCILF